MSARKGFWSRPVVQEELKPVVVVQTWSRLSEREIDDAFKGNETAQWWRALVQIIDDSRGDYLMAAAQNAPVNNPLGMALEIGAHQALSNLLTVLEAKVHSAQ